MENEVYLHSFKSILPTYEMPQSGLVDWIVQAHQRSDEVGYSEHDLFEERLKRYSLGENFIKRRFFECRDVSQNWEHHEIYRLTKKEPKGAGTAERNRFFLTKSLRVFEQLYEAKTPEHIIHVTCTGYISPSPAQAYFSTKDSAPEITHAYHMGCYASLPSIRMARGWSLSHQKEIDIVHNELCSLHLNTGLHTPEQMVVQSLFADGHIKYSVGPNADNGFVIKTVFEKLIPNSLEDMTWTPGGHGMLMTLSREVPLKIRDGISQFIEQLAKRANRNADDLLKHGIFAIHPGGPRIIEVVQKKLEISDEQVRHSKEVLLDRGNMSSATLPHVWEKILRDSLPSGTPVISLAFGPGLTIFGALFEVK